MRAGGVIAPTSLRPSSRQASILPVLSRTARVLPSALNVARAEGSDRLRGGTDLAAVGRGPEIDLLVGCRDRDRSPARGDRQRHDRGRCWNAGSLVASGGIPGSDRRVASARDEGTIAHESKRGHRSPDGRKSADVLVPSYIPEPYLAVRASAGESLPVGREGDRRDRRAVGAKEGHAAGRMGVEEADSALAADGQRAGMSCKSERGDRTNLRLNDRPRSSEHSQSTR